MCGTAGCDVITKADVSTGLHGGDDQRVHPAPTITCIGERTPAAEVGLAFHPASPSATGVLAAKTAIYVRLVHQHPSPDASDWKADNREESSPVCL